MKQNHRKVVRNVCPTVAVRLPRPRQAPYMPLIIVETDDNVEERGIQKHERVDTLHSHDISRAPHWKYAPGKNPISSCAVLSIVNGLDRATEEAISGWAGKLESGRRHWHDPHRAEGSSRDINRSDVVAVDTLESCFETAQSGGNRSHWLNQ